MTVDTDDSEFITRLICFGLSEKEAQLYLHLLKYGPKPSSMLAKSLKTYREDIYRTLNGLVDKGMVNPSLESPMVYMAVELKIALETALKKHESELRDLEIRKRELEEMSKQQRFSPSDEFSTVKIIKSLKELIGLAMPAVATTVEEWVVVCPAVFFVVASLYTIEEHKKFIGRGGKIKVITDFSDEYLESVQQHLDIGADVRQLTGYQGIMFSVFDKKISTSAINVDIDRISLDTPVSLVWTDDPAYAACLMSTFEMLWKQAIPAAQRIEELLKEGASRHLRDRRTCYRTK
ncbi:MAG TPA: helix-turn-helix domain-containing protein [Candidatus Acidoferrum sp.]|nr:helix-turn-helix domain-containing protein [Candidatus Acidoferrum sp.]